MRKGYYVQARFRRSWICSFLLLTASAILVGPGPLLAQRRFPYVYDNQALGKEAYMVRLTDKLPPAAHGNDNNLSTVVRTTERYLFGYWVVDQEKE
jgi:hypothetical protein